MFLLQAEKLFTTKHDPRINIAVIVIMMVFAVLIILSRIVKKAIDGSSRSKKKKEQPDTVSRREIHRVCRLFDMDADQEKFFIDVCFSYNVTNPEFYLTNDDAADTLFKKVFHQLSSLPDRSEAEKKETILFSIRQAVEARRRETGLPTSTKNLREDQPLILTTTDREQYPTAVIKNEPEGLYIAVPRDMHKNQIRPPVLSKITIFVPGKAGVSYTFSGRIVRYDNSTARPSMLVSHTNSISVLHIRQFRRKTFKTPCIVSHVEVYDEVHGSKKSRVYKPTGQAGKGIMTDISAGGCSIFIPLQAVSLPPFAEKQFINIEFQITGKNTDTITGSVVKINKRDDNAYIMHIRFVRMSRKTQNEIFSFVYDYC